MSNREHIALPTFLLKCGTGRLATVVHGYNMCSVVGGTMVFDTTDDGVTGEKQEGTTANTTGLG